MIIKKYIILLMAVVLFAACEKEDEDLLFTAKGTVIDYAGCQNCNVIIELDNGDFLQALYYPEGFVFSEGQQVELDYNELKNVIMGCAVGSPCEILSIEEISCPAPIRTEEAPSASLAGDPVVIRGMEVVGDILHISVSYLGGSENHEFQLLWKQDSKDGTPVLELIHDSNLDIQDEQFSQVLRFDISEILEEGWEEGFKLVNSLYSGKSVVHIVKLRSNI